MDSFPSMNMLSMSRSHFGLLLNYLNSLHCLMRSSSISRSSTSVSIVIYSVFSRFLSKPQSFIGMYMVEHFLVHFLRTCATYKRMGYMEKAFAIAPWIHANIRISRCVIWQLRQCLHTNCLQLLFRTCVNFFLEH